MSILLENSFVQLENHRVKNTDRKERSTFDERCPTRKTRMVPESNYSMRVAGVDEKEIDSCTFYISEVTLH